MSKKKKRSSGTANRPVSNDNRALMKIGVATGIMLFVLVGFGAFISRQNSNAGISSGAQPVHPAAPLPTPQYSANAPAREYVYAGSKLLAVSEPVQPAPNDLAVWRLSTGTWYVMGDGGGITQQTWGVSTDKPAAGDYDGDGKTDFCVYRPSEGKWYMILSGTTAIDTHVFGESGDVPIPGDYDGDGRSDYALYRPTNQTFYIKNIASGVLNYIQYGASGDVPLASDYDGDGKTDPVLWRDSNATWYVYQTSNGTWANYQWGASGDTPVPGDYDGDARSDYAVWKSDGSWVIRKSSDGTTMGGLNQWGVASDIKVQGDYDSDGKTDRAVWRPSNGTWYIVKSSNGNYRIQAWGENGDIPVPAPYRR